MEKKNVMPFVVAVLLGIVSVISVNRYIQSKSSKTKVKAVKIIVAKSAIPAESVITSGQLTTRVIPVGALSEVNISVPLGESPRELKETARKKSLVIGRVATRAIPAGDPVLWSDFRKPQVSCLSGKLPENMRAVTIPVDSNSSVGFNIVPGDHVDILATSSRGCGGYATTMVLSGASGTVRKKMEPATYILMQNVPVLAVAQNFNTFTTLSNRKMTYSNITLEVTLEEALMLVQARSRVKLSCILRAPGAVDRMPSAKLHPVTCSMIKERLLKKLDAERAKMLDSSKKISSKGQMQQKKKAESIK